MPLTPQEDSEIIRVVPPVDKLDSEISCQISTNFVISLHLFQTPTNPKVQARTIIRSALFSPAMARITASRLRDMLPNLPPGPLYLAQRLHHFLSPPAAVYLCATILGPSQLAIISKIPSWLLAFLVAAAAPAAFVAERSYRRWKIHRRARALGADVIQDVEEKWPSILGLSVIRRFGDSFKDGYPGEPFLDWMKESGNVFQLPFLTDSRIMTVEPDHVKAILATQFENFGKGPIFFSQMETFLGTGVFNSDGDMWKFHRSMTRPFFTRERISDFDTFDAHTEDALTLARNRLAEGYAFDFQDLIARFTLDSATEFLFGYNVNSLSAGLAYPPTSGKPNTPEFVGHASNIFVNAFIAGQTYSGHRTRLGPHWPLVEFWSNKVAPHRAVVDTYLDPLLEKAMADLKLREAKGDDAGWAEEEATLLQHLVHRTQDPKVLKDELLNLLVAGRDTTACTLTYAFYMLAEHPAIADRLRKEIVGKLGYTRRPGYDDMRELKYLRAFINEVLRLYPPVPFDSRTSVDETVWTQKTPQGIRKHYIPPRSRVLYSILYMHRRKDLWGPDAEEFDPDRFIDERLQKYLLPNPYIFCPFNAGPRICLGQQFAYHEASFFLIRLLQQFKNFRLAPDAFPEEAKPNASWAARGGRLAKEKVKPAAHLTLYIRGGLWVKMDEFDSTNS